MTKGVHMGTSRRLEMQIPCQDCELLDISRGGIHRASADLSSARLARRGFPTFRVRMAHPPGTNHVNGVMRASATAVMRCVRVGCTRYTVDNPAVYTRTSFVFPDRIRRTSVR